MALHDHAGDGAAKEATDGEDGGNERKYRV